MKMNKKHKGMQRKNSYDIIIKNEYGLFDDLSLKKRIYKDMNVKGEKLKKNTH